MFAPAMVARSVNRHALTHKRGASAIASSGEYSQRMGVARHTLPDPGTSGGNTLIASTPPSGSVPVVTTILKWSIGSRLLKDSGVAEVHVAPPSPSYGSAPVNGCPSVDSFQSVPVRVSRRASDIPLKTLTPVRAYRLAC